MNMGLETGKVLRSLAVWLLIIVAESIHGTLRTLFLEPVLGGPAARRLSVFTGVLLIFAVTYLCIKWIGESRSKGLIAIGLGWVFLTVIFEIALGRLVLGLTWERLLADYDITNGGLMGIGLILMALVPLATARLRGIPAD